MTKQTPTTEDKIVKIPCKDFYEYALLSAYRNMGIFLFAAVLTYVFIEDICVAIFGGTISILFLLNACIWFHHYWSYKMPVDKSWIRMKMFLDKGMYK